MDVIEEFGAQLLCLPQIFKRRVFSIPDYQRSYAWDERQVEELLKDIDHLLDDGVTHRHYTGTLVLSKMGDHALGAEYHVVDGQQRLTTLVVLLRALATHLPSEQRASFDSLYLRRGAVGSDRCVLQLNSDTRHFFERVVLGDGKSSNEPMNLEAHERLARARKLVFTWMEGRITAGTTVDQLRTSILDELGFLVYAPKEDAETGIMFEVINNRGKPLSELEKVKNYLIYCCVKLGSKTLRETIDYDWSVILRHLNIAKKTSPGEESSFLRYCVAVHFRLNKTDSQQGYDQIKKIIALDKSMSEQTSKDSAILKIAAFVQFLKFAALWYARLYGQQHAGINKDLLPVLEQIRGQDVHASIMPLFLSLVIRNEGEGAKLRHLLHLLECINFRVYLAHDMTARTDSGQGDLYFYAASYFHRDLLQSIPQDQRVVRKEELVDDDEALEYRLVEFGMYHAADAAFEKSFRLENESTYDYFRWGALRYFLMNYEQDLQPNKTIRIDKILLSRGDGRSADYLSVEHRWAIGNRVKSGENDRAIDFFEKRRIGNFTLLELRLNIQASNASLEDKIERYLGRDDEPPTDLEQVRKMAKDAKIVLKDMDKMYRSKNYYLGIQRKISDRAEDRFVKFALRRWGLKHYLGYSDIIKRSRLEGVDEGEL